MTTCEMRVRHIIREHRSLPVSELVRLAGYTEDEVRAVLHEMERNEEGYRSRDLPTGAEWFTGWLVGLGKKMIERRLHDQADRLEVPVERMDWTPTTESGEQAYTLTITSQGTERACVFTESELEECVGGEENPNIIDSRLFKLVSRYRVGRIV